MQEEYSRGIAFIFEGETEKVFYSLLLRHYCTRNPSFSLEKRLNEKSGEVFYELVGEKGRVLVMMYVVGTISQITN